jgi:hypothetical protein
MNWLDMSLLQERPSGKGRGLRKEGIRLGGGREGSKMIIKR